MIKAVVFDLDDTLYNEKDFVEGGFYKVCEYLSHKYKVNEKVLFNETKNILYKSGRGKIFNLLCEKFSFSEDINKLVKIYREAMPDLKLYKDSEEIITYLYGKYKLGVITDGKASVQWNKIKCLGLEKRFDKIIVTDDLGREYWKPNEYSYRKIIEEFNCRPSEAMYIGDNPTKDFIGAKKVGFLTVRIIRKNGDNMKLKADTGYEADFSITNLNEIINILH